MGEDWVVDLLPRELAVACCDCWMPLIYQALPKGEWNLSELLKDIKADRSALFLVSKDGIVHAAGVLQVVTYPLTRKVRIFALAGEGMSLWKHAVDEFLQSFARTVGASGLELVGRKGFVRALSDLGYVERYVVMEKEVVGNG